MKVKEESEKNENAGLELNIQKTRIMTSSPISSWQIEGKQWKQWQTIFLGSKITADGDCSHEITGRLLFERKVIAFLLLLSHFSRVQLCVPHRRQPTRLPHPWDSPGKNTGVGCHFLIQCMKVKCETEVAQSFPTLSDPMDCRLPGFSVHGIFEARVLEWGAIAFYVAFLDSILKSRGVTLPSKVHLVKAMVFPVVMYVCIWKLDNKES